MDSMLKQEKVEKGLDNVKIKEDVKMIDEIDVRIKDEIVDNMAIENGEDTGDIIVSFTSHPHLDVRVCVQNKSGYMITLHGPYDTGSQLSFLNVNVWKSNEWSTNLRPYGRKVRGAGGNEIPTFGVIELPCIIEGKEIKQDFVLASICEQVLLGLDFMMDYQASWNMRENRIKYEDWDEPPISFYQLEPLMLS